MVRLQHLTVRQGSGSFWLALLPAPWMSLCLNHRLGHPFSCACFSDPAQHRLSRARKRPEAVVMVMNALRVLCGDHLGARPAWSFCVTGPGRC
ncbi:hypothetical protein HDV63DRAFT_382884 [Trichoderma sp. SZMC 28014]